MIFIYIVFSVSEDMKFISKLFEHFRKKCLILLQIQNIF